MVKVVYRYVLWSGKSNVEYKKLCEGIRACVSLHTNFTLTVISIRYSSFAFWRLCWGLIDLQSSGVSWHVFVSCWFLSEEFSLWSPRDEEFVLVRLTNFRSRIGACAVFSRRLFYISLGALMGLTWIVIQEIVSNGSTRVSVAFSRCVIVVITGIPLVAEGVCLRCGNPLNILKNLLIPLSVILDRRAHYCMRPVFASVLGGLNVAPAVSDRRIVGALTALRFLLQ